MPQPTVATTSVFAKSNKVVKIEFLPIPNVPADFALNHMIEVLLGMMRDLWERIGPSVVSGFGMSFGSGQWTVGSGRILVDGYDVTFGSNFVFTPIASDQEVILRVIESQLTFESDPGIVGFVPPGGITAVKGMNQYRYVASLVHQAVGTAVPSLTGNQTKIKQFRLFRIAADTTTLTERTTLLPFTLHQEMQILLDQITVFAPATTSTIGVSKMSGTPPVPASPTAAMVDADSRASVVGITRKASTAGSGAIDVGANTEDTSVVLGHSASTGVTAVAAGSTTGAFLARNKTLLSGSANTIVAKFQQNVAGVDTDIMKIMGMGGLRLLLAVGSSTPGTDEAQFELRTNGLSSPNRRLVLGVRWPDGTFTAGFESEAS